MEPGSQSSQLEADRASTVAPVSMRELVRVFGRIGLMSFGGPAGQIALMHRVLVEEKRWLDEDRFLHALNLCMLLPGPEAMQLATYSGWLVRGTRGGLVAGLLFIIPGAFVLTALSAIFVFAGHLPVIAGLLFGLQASVLAVVVQAVVRLATRAVRTRVLMAVTVAAFLAIAVLHVPFPLVILGAALTGIIRSRFAAGEMTQPATTGNAGQTRLAGTAQILAIWLGLWLAPLAGLVALLGEAHVFAAEALFFSRMAVVTFGGAHAVLAYVGQQAVDTYGWLTPGEMLTGLGLAETTPGPLILVLVFVGFLGGARLSGFAPLAGGLAGALVALWFTFVPSFLWILVGTPYVEAIRRVRWLEQALRFVTAAVVGVIANLALWFGLRVLFAHVGELRLGPLALPTVDVESFNSAAGAIAAVSALALIGLRLPLGVVLLGAAVVGAAVRLTTG